MSISLAKESALRVLRKVSQAARKAIDGGEKEGHRRVTEQIREMTWI
jgi:hypothetical protein